MKTEKETVVALTDNHDVMHLVIPEAPGDGPGDFTVGEVIIAGCVCNAGP